MGIITLIIATDSTPELNEVTQVTLTAITANGIPTSGDQSRGARLAAGQSVAVITVQANDEPHGVVTWSPDMVLAEEEEGRDNVLQLSLVREFGDIGAIIVSYTTEMAVSLPLEEQAVSLQDFIPVTSDVVIGDGDSSVNISIVILQVRM
jgi:hypothetical protein